MWGQALDRLGAAHGTGAEAAAALAAQEAATAATAATSSAALRASHGELRALSATGTQLLGKFGTLMRQGQTTARQLRGPVGEARVGRQLARHNAQGRKARLARLRARVHAGEARLQALCDRLAALVA